MTRQNLKKLGFYYFVVMVLTLASCESQLQKAIEVCPGAKSAIDSLSLLRSRTENIVPLKANGRCLLQYYDEDEKYKKENFAVKLWVNPPSQICLQGDVAFNPKGIVLGSNKDEFWLSMKPKEISSYWWGKWAEGDGFGGLKINPKNLLEAFGVSGVSDAENWSLSKEGDFDVLTERDDKGTETRKMYINRCGYMVRKIVYFDVNGQVLVVTELDEYEEVSEGFFVPAVIKIIRPVKESEQGLFSIALSLRSIRATDFSEKQKGRIFIRPEPRGFEHIYKIIDGTTIEQRQ